VVTPSKEQHPREYGGAVGWWGVVFPLKVFDAV
jgi:hypothetical protein